MTMPRKNANKFKMQLFSPVLLVVTSSVCLAGTLALRYSVENPLCGLKQLTGPEGTITSPNYPVGYPDHISCTWVITSPPGAVLTIRIHDLDLEEEDPGCIRQNCCQQTWLSVPQDGGGGTWKLCGHNRTLGSVSVTQQHTLVKFHSSKAFRGGRGFRLTYTIDEAQQESCRPLEVRCPDGRCIATLNDIPASLVCSMVQCAGRDMVPCGDHDPQCYNNITQRCNGIQDCSSGVDELGCARCQRGQLSCRAGGGCYSAGQACDGKVDCTDYSDELNCHLCPSGQALCNSVIEKCFTPSIELCDGKLDCPFGEDEVNCVQSCEDQIACSNGQGCYSPSQRCNSVRNCHDSSDEADCPKELCALMQDKFQCDNGRCISYHYWCNGEDDCGDNSDEESCIKTSIITAAIMGSLICGLLLVIAVGCMCRLYSMRLAASSGYRSHHDLSDTLRVALPPPDDFFHREPPPAYSVAVSDCQQLQRMALQNGGVPHEHHHQRRSSRRHRRSQRGMVTSAQDTASGVSDPRFHQEAENKSPDALVSTISGEERGASQLYEGGFVELQCEADLTADCRNGSPQLSSSTNSTSLSPSRESVTSSTSLMSYLSSNDDTQLLVPVP